MNRRYKTLLRARKRNCNILWSEYRSLRNKTTSEGRLAKSNPHNPSLELEDVIKAWRPQILVKLEYFN